MPPTANTCSTRCFCKRLGARRTSVSSWPERSITRALMIEAGYSPSVRLFEAAACACPIISDPWPGLDQFFEPGREILLAESSDQVLEYLKAISPAERERIGRRARARIVGAHTPAHRAAELEKYLLEWLG